MSRTPHLSDFKDFWPKSSTILSLQSPKIWKRLVFNFPSYDLEKVKGQKRGKNVQKTFLFITFCLVKIKFWKLVTVKSLWRPIDETSNFRNSSKICSKIEVWIFEIAHFPASITRMALHVQINVVLHSLHYFMIF